MNRVNLGSKAKRSMKLAASTILTSSGLPIRNPLASPPVSGCACSCRGLFHQAVNADTLREQSHGRFGRFRPLQLTIQTQLSLPIVSRVAEQSSLAVSFVVVPTASCHVSSAGTRFSIAHPYLLLWMTDNHLGMQHQRSCCQGPFASSACSLPIRPYMLTFPLSPLRQSISLPTGHAAGLWK